MVYGAEALKPKLRQRKEYVYILQDAGDSPGKILAVCKTSKRAEKERDQPGMPRYTTILKQPVLE